MTFLHFRYRQRLGLLASSVLEPREADWVLRHTTNCASCQGELSELTEVATQVARGAARDLALPISSEALRTRVLARVRTERHHTAAGRAWRLAPAITAMGLVGLGLVAGIVITRDGIRQDPPASLGRIDPAESETVLNDTAFYERLEKTHLRANAARYLAEAQDVLMQVTAASVDCPDSSKDSPKDRVDVTREAQTSRSLLRRRAAIVSGSEETLVAAQGVMEEVEGLLQRVADLPQCTRRSDVDAIARVVDRRHLLMKIDLVSQELGAP